MEKITHFRPAYDKRNVNGKNYGIHGAELLMILKGDYGAVEFVVYTNWHLPHVQAELLKTRNDELDIKCSFLPFPSNLGYHSKQAMYEGQDVASTNCEYCDREPCYCDGTSLGSTEVFNILVKEGSDAVWTFLKKYYVDTFGELK